MCIIFYADEKRFNVIMNVKAVCNVIITLPTKQGFSYIMEMQIFHHHSRWIFFYLFNNEPFNFTERSVLNRDLCVKIHLIAMLSLIIA